MTTRSTVIVGAQWGDEGKGKIVDVLSEHADSVVRYQGGNNAGHTIVREGETFKLHLLPSGLIWGKKSYIGAGVVLDPKSLFHEITTLEEKGIRVKGLLGIDFRTSIVFPWHQLIDSAREAQKGSRKIGTTGRGIGPCYEDAYARLGLRVVDMLDKTFEEKFSDLYSLKRDILEKIYSIKTLPSLPILLEHYKAYARQLESYAVDVSALVQEELRNGHRVIFEGAQAAMLDCRFGTYPYVTSSHPGSSGVSIGVGISIKDIDVVEGVAKAYTTRVGGGPFPTELVFSPTTSGMYDVASFKEREAHNTEESAIGEYIRRNGFEFGTTTGRPRRTGWFDVPVIRTGHRFNGYTGLHITKLDVLGGLETLKICTSYLLDKQKLETLPSSTDDLARVVPQYLTLNGFEDIGFSGWREVVRDSEKKGFSALPDRAREYIETIEKYVGIPILSVSVGPERNAIIWRK